MADNNKQAPERQKKRLALEFLYANVGEAVVEQLGKEESYVKVFPAEIAEKIRAKKEDYATQGDFMAQVVTPVMDAFLDVTCPTVKTNPQMAGWVCNQYLTHRHNDKPMMAEDLYKISDNIRFFNGVRSSPGFTEKSQLLQYKTYAEFMETLEPYLQRKAQKDELAAAFNMTPQEKEKILAETTVLYDGPEGRVVVPHTPNASKYWGSNTKWCIAGKDHYENGPEYAETHFPDYNAKSPVIMLLPKGQSDNKVALVDHRLYDSKDAVINALPELHNNLMQSCLDGLSAGARKGIAPWIPDAAVPAIVDPAPADPALQEIVREEFYNIDILRHTPNAVLWRDRAFVLEAVRQYGRQYGRALYYASDELKQDREIVLTAVRQNGSALYYAADELKKDREIVLTAVRQNGFALQDAAKELRESRDFVTRLLETVDDLPFEIRDIKKDAWCENNVWQPDDAALMNYQVKALERMAERGDIEKFAKYARHFKSTWGDADTLFAADPAATLDKIRAEVAAQYPAAKTAPRFAASMS